MNFAENSKNPCLRSMGDGTEISWALWDQETVDEAVRKDVPLCLCIVNSRSRWSGAMKENLADAEIVQLLNKDYVPVLADSGDDPSLTLAARAMAQIMNGHAGWPLFLFLTPKLEPIFAASYMPKQSASASNPGFLDVLRRIKWLWVMKRPQIDQAAASYRRQMEEALSPYSGQVKSDLSSFAAGQLMHEADRQSGGWGRKPKFPHASRLMLSAFLAERDGDGELKAHVDRSLAALFQGGLYDHLEGGFHDYCRDAHWHEPCLGKKLALNACLIMAFAEGSLMFNNSLYAQVAKNTADSMLTSLARGDGLFSAGEIPSPETDRFYLWTEQDVQKALGADCGDFCRLYGITEEGNFGDVLTDRREGNNILRFTELQLERAHDAQWWQKMTENVSSLARVRSKRPSPALDETAPVCANALFASALVQAAFLPECAAYVGDAATIAKTLLKRALQDGRLCRSLRGETREGDGALEDYAALIQACLELYKALGTEEWLQQAATLAETAMELFGSSGAMKLSAQSVAALPDARDAGDDDIPSANGMMLNNFVTLYEITKDDRWKKRAWTLADDFGGALSHYPAACSSLVLGTVRLQRPLPAEAE